MIAHPDADPILAVEHLTVRFGGLTAVSDLSFAAQTGEILSIIGPNGAGKTTVFNCITGFQRPTGGRVVFMGRPVTALRPDLIVARGIARTFQLIRLFPTLLAVENVMLGLHARTRAGTFDAMLHTPAHRREEAWIREEAHRWLAFVGLEHRARQQARTLAYGDQRRLEIARAMASGPRLLVLDEPASGMNPAEKDDLARLVAEINREGTTVLLVEQNANAALRLAHRGYVLENGRIALEGTGAELARHEGVRRSYLGIRVLSDGNGPQAPAGRGPAEGTPGTRREL